MTWQVAHGRSLALERPCILGILNATPDSFSDGGRYLSGQDALARAGEILEEGGEVIDIGGESTRPGAAPVSLEEEIRRVVPLVEEISHRWPEAILSVDTVKSGVAARALDAGAHIVNDVSGFRLDPEMGEICASRAAGVVLMHSRGGFGEMASYAMADYGHDPMGEVIAELEGSVAEACRHGIARASIVVDPGLGFAKRGDHSVAMLADLGRLVERGHPVLVGASRKRFIGELTGEQQAHRRDAGSIGAHVVALARGARLFRVHDVRAHRHALDVASAIVSRG